MEASVDFDRLQDVNKSTLETHLRWSTIGSHAYEARDLPDTFPLSEQPSFFLYGFDGFLLVNDAKTASLFNKNKQVGFCVRFG